MVVFLVVVGCGILLGATAVAPFFLPWPAQVRWLLAARWMSLDGLAADGLGPFQMEETRLLAVETGPTGLLAVVADPHQSGHGFRTRLVGPRPGIGVLAAMEGWAAAATPLLLVSEGDGLVSLFGPRTSVVGLRAAGADQSSPVAG
jgi:hypothetical protein